MSFNLKMMEKKNVKTNLLNPAQAKVRLLGEYLKRYLNIICNEGYTKRIKMYDLFCGEGTYENGGEGSPIVTMRQIKDIHFINIAKASFIPKIDCHLYDIDSNKVEKVKANLRFKAIRLKPFAGGKFQMLLSCSGKQHAHNFVSSKINVWAPPPQHSDRACR